MILAACQFDYAIEVRPMNTEIKDQLAPLAQDEPAAEETIAEMTAEEASATAEEKTEKTSAEDCEKEEIIPKDVKYKWHKHYKTAKYPIRQPIYLTWLIWVLSQMMLIGKKKKVECINMEGLKPPYMILSNHMSFVDFELLSLGTYPQRMNNVVNIDGYYLRAWLMEWIGSIGTRKFTSDIHLIKSIRKVLSRGDVLCMYPEARYSPCGTSSYLPESLGMLIKRCKVPIVIVKHRGNHLLQPAWNVKNNRKVPLHATIKLSLTVEDIEKMSAKEINEFIKSEMTYDDYEYQKENGILITEPKRAEGLHKVLYQCPHCKTEFKMNSLGTEIFCEECGKRWNLEEDGSLKATEGETEFARVPDWFEWEREQVRAEIERGEYSFSDDVEIYSQPGCYSFPHLGRGTLVHNEKDGFVVRGHYNGEDFCIHRMPIQTNSLHVEYGFGKIKPVADCIDVSTENDSFYCYPTKRNVVTKIAFATEILYQRCEKRTARKKRGSGDA